MGEILHHRSSCKRHLIFIILRTGFHFQLCNGNSLLVCENPFFFCSAEFSSYSRIAGEQSGEYRELNYAGGISGIESHPNGSLIISKVSEEHSGNFLCQASNGIGAILSKLIRLTVHGKTTINCVDFHKN